MAEILNDWKIHTNWQQFHIYLTPSRRRFQIVFKLKSSRLQIPKSTTFFVCQKLTVKTRMEICAWQEQEHLIFRGRKKTTKREKMKRICKIVDIILHEMLSLNVKYVLTSSSAWFNRFYGKIWVLFSLFLPFWWWSKIKWKSSSSFFFSSKASNHQWKPTPSDRQWSGQHHNTPNYVIRRRERYI